MPNDSSPPSPACRVAIAVTNYPPLVGGLESHVSSLARSLAGLGHDVRVLTVSGPPGEAVEDGVHVRRWPAWFMVGGLWRVPSPRSGASIWRALTSDVDVISVHTRFFPLTWLAVAAGRWAGVPVIHTEHGSGFVASPDPVIRAVSRMVDLTAGRLALRGATRVVGVSREVVSFVWRLARVRAEVFHNAIEPPPVPGVAPSPRRVVAFVGRIVPGKGWEDFLSALSRQDAAVMGQVLGVGSDLDALRARVEQLGLSDRVAVRGRVPLAEVYEVLAGGILVNPTRLAEGFQTTLLEALAVGARVVTYPVPGAQLLVEDGAPVTVTAATVDELAAALRRELEEPRPAWPAEKVASWTWPGRGREFSALLNRTVARARAVGRRRSPRAG